MKKNDDELRTFSIRIIGKQYTKLSKLAKATNRSINYHIQEAITRYLEKNKQVQFD